MPKATPARVVSGAASVLAALLLTILAAATQRPWLGMDFHAADAGAVRIASVDPSGPGRAVPPGAVVERLRGASGEPVALLADDLVEEPAPETYDGLRRFYARQDALAALLRSGPVALELATGERIVVSPRASRPVRTLPAVFWVQLAVGALSFLLGAWVWSLRRGERSAAILAGIGASILCFSFPAAVYSTRELAIGGPTFRTLLAFNTLGALSFGIAMIALFLVYPRRLAPGRAIFAAAILVYAYWALDFARASPAGPQGNHMLIALEMAGIVAASLWQYRRTRGDAVARAALRAFGLAVLVGAGGFVALVNMPVVLGTAPVISQGYGFLFFLLIFGGVALGVARYRLFALEGWSFRILFYLAGAVLLLAIDAALIYSLTLGREATFALSLVAVALFYLPLRDWLGRLLLRAPRRRPMVYHRVIDAALAPNDRDANGVWRALLQDVFSPLGLEARGAGPEEPAIAAEGAALLLPGNGPVAPLRLQHADGGRRLFGPQDLALARELCTLLGHALASRDAYERGVAEERARVARDIHDNIGAQLLSALHSAEPERKDALIRETIGDIRGIVNDAARGHRRLDEALAELRLEASQRLALSGIELAWQMDQIDAAPAPHPQLVHGLRSILREGLSNAIRHSGADRVSVLATCRDGRLALSIADNGRGLGDAVVPGNGLANMRVRAAALKGRLSFDDNAPGLRLNVEMPI